MKRRNSILTLLLAVPICLAEARAAELRAFSPIVRTGDRLVSAPVLIGRSVMGPNNAPAQSSLVRENGRYVLELEGTGARGQVRVFLRRVDKQEANNPTSHAIGELTCSIRKLVGPNNGPGVVKGVVQPEDRPRSLNELGFRANAAVDVQTLGSSFVLQLRGVDPPPPNADGVSRCSVKLTLQAAP